MSAYIVQDECINSIVTWLFNPRQFEYWNDSGLISPNHEKQLGAAMFDMNVRAVNARYGANQAQEFRPLDYQYRPDYSGSGLAVYDRLGELLYQCAEGDIPELDPLYRALENIRNQMARNFLQDMRESKEQRENSDRRDLRLRIEKLEQQLNHGRARSH